MDMNIIEVFTKFPDQESCISYLEHIRWQNEPKCPYCQSTQSTSRKGTIRHQCNKCNNSYSVLVGTIFEGTKLSLNKWFFAIALILNAKKGLSSLQLARDIGVNRKKAGIYKCVLEKRWKKAMTLIYLVV